MSLYFHFYLTRSSRKSSPALSLTSYPIIALTGSWAVSMLDVNGHSIYFQAECCNLRWLAAVWTWTGLLALSTGTGRQIGHWGLGVSMCVRVCPMGQEADMDTRVVWYVGNLSPLITWWNLSHQAKDRPRLSHSQKISQRETDRESLLSVQPETWGRDWATLPVTLQQKNRRVYWNKTQIPRIRHALRPKQNVILSWGETDIAIKAAKYVKSVWKSATHENVLTSFKISLLCFSFSSSVHVFFLCFDLKLETVFKVNISTQSR